jgi:hypothetical protein
MSFWSKVRGLFGARPTYIVVWREHVAAGTIMKGEPISGKSDTDAISLVRARFMHVDPDWTFWILFRPDNGVVTAQQGPKFAKWFGDFTHVSSDSHVMHTLESVRRHGASVSRPLHKVRLKSRGQRDDVEGN